MITFISFLFLINSLICLVCALQNDNNKNNFALFEKKYQNNLVVKY